MTTFNWLHLTDWHVGQSGQRHVWPNLRSEFERDLGELIDKQGPIDLVFFTGDLVQHGSRGEYEALEEHLLSLWSFLASKGSNPKLVAIPGNHDLRRPEPSKSWVLALRSWERDLEVRNAFWDQPKSDFRKNITKAFEEFSRWQSNSKIECLPMKVGLLPGDSSSTFSKDGYQIGIIGLNTTFLQLEKGNYESRLAVSARQFAEVCDRDYTNWLSRHHISVLLTHQPKSWLCETSRQEFAREIAPQGRFHLHLCGHLHESATVFLSEGGGPPLRTHQGTSLFGLEFFGEGKSEVRKHGYLFGQWQIADTNVSERLWPRVAHNKQGGALGLGPDSSHYLQEDNSILTNFTISLPPAIGSPETGRGNPGAPQSEAVKFLNSTVSDPVELQSKLGRVSKFLPSAPPHALIVRSDERYCLKQALTERRAAWVIADWGTGEDAFIASVVRSEADELGEGLIFGDNVYHLRCDTFESPGDIEQGFRPQFGVTMQEFLQCVVAVPRACLVHRFISSCAFGFDKIEST